MQKLRHRWWAPLLLLSNQLISTLSYNIVISSYMLLFFTASVLDWSKKVCNPVKVWVEGPRQKEYIEDTTYG